MKDTWEGELDPLHALREGRPGPYTAFVESETPTFLGFFRRLGAGRSEAEDLTQETLKKLFLLATQPSRSVAYDARGQFRGYAFRVARNVWIDANRKRASAPATRGGEAGALILSESADLSHSSPLEQLDRDEEARRIRDAVAQLPPGQHQVFELGVLQELPYSEIAASLEIPIGTVKSRMHHAVLKVRAALEAKDHMQEQIRRRHHGPEGHAGGAGA